MPNKSIALNVEPEPKCIDVKYVQAVYDNANRRLRGEISVEEWEAEIKEARGAAMNISFQVEGLPLPKGSTKAFVRNGRANIVQTNASSLYAWESRIGYAAKQAGATMTRHPVAISAHFYFARPKSHYSSAGLKRSAPKHHQQRPDTDKLLRAVLDALTGIVYVDDCLVVYAMATKAWDTHSHAEISVIDELGAMENDQNDKILEERN